MSKIHLSTDCFLVTILLLFSAAGLAGAGTKQGATQPAYRLDQLPKVKPASKCRESLRNAKSYWLAKAPGPEEASKLAAELSDRFGWTETQDPDAADVVVFNDFQTYTYGNHPSRIPTSPTGGDAAMPTRRFLHVFAILTNSQPPKVLRYYEKRTLSDQSVAKDAIKDLEIFIKKKD
jgi:hypothetical protein